MINDANPSEELFCRALGLSPDARDAFLADACGSDTGLRRRVQELIAAADEHPGFLPAEHGDEATVAATAFEVFSSAEEPGMTVGPYKLLERLGEGGFGAVWAAEQKKPVRRRVALKFIKLGMDTKQVVARFEAERQALALMDHPNIAKVLDAGATEEGRLYFVMELVKGIPITTYCERENLPVHERLELFIKICQAIQHAHQKGIIHRDIKPSNVLVTLHDGVPVPKVIDFGIAKATQQELTELTIYTQFHQFVGTPAYMSPEQAEMSGLDIDTRSDVYGLGVLLYELLTGTTPFDKTELMQSGIDAMRKIIRERDPARPSTRLSQSQGAALPSSPTKAHRPASLPSDLDWIVMKCLEKDRTRRYETANGLAFDIKRHLANEPVVARPPSMAYKLQKAWKRNRLVYTAAATVAAALVAGVAASTWQAKVAESARAKAQANFTKATEAEARLETALDLATSEKHRAEANADTALLNLYAADMNLVQHALLEGDLGRARQLIEHYRNLDPDIRGFEWHLFWDQAQGDQFRTIDGFEGMVGSVVFTPGENDWFAVATTDGRVTLHHVDPDVAPTRLTSRRKHQLRMHQLAFSPDGAVLASVGESGIELWDTTDWSRVSVPDPASFTMSGKLYSSLCFSPSGGWFAARRDRGVQLWDARTWEAVAEILADDVRVFGRPLDFIDETRLAVGVGDRVEVWEIDRETEQLGPLDGWPNPSLASGAGAIVSDGRFLAAISAPIRSHETVDFFVWELETGDVVASRPGAHGNFAFDLRLSPDGSRIYSAGGDQAIKVWSFPDLELLDVLLGHGNEVWSLDFSDDGKTLVSGGKGGTARLWETDRGEPKSSPPQPPGYGRLSEDGERLVAWPNEGEWTVWDAATGALAARFETDGEVLAFPARDRLLFFRWGDTSPSLIIERADFVAGGLAPLSVIEGIDRSDAREIMGSADGRRVVLAMPERFEVWDVDGVRKVAELANPGDHARIRAFSGGGERLFLETGDQDSNRVLTIWMPDGRTPPVEIDLQPTFGGKVCVSPRGEVFALENFANNSLFLVRCDDGSIVSELIGHTSSLSDVKFSPDGRTLITDNRSTTRLWNVATQREIARYDHGQDYPSPRLSIEGFSRGTNLGGNVEFWRVGRPR